MSGGGCPTPGPGRECLHCCSVEGSVAASLAQRQQHCAKVGGLCWPLTAVRAYVQPHGSANQERNHCLLSGARTLCKGHLHCWMTMNPQGICYHLNISQVHAEQVIVCWGRQGPNAKCSRELWASELTPLLHLSGDLQKAGFRGCRAMPPVPSGLARVGGRSWGVWWVEVRIAKHPSKAQFRFLD